jgi:flagellar L-ring protein FlgH
MRRTASLIITTSSLCLWSSMALAQSSGGAPADPKSKAVSPALATPPVASEPVSSPRGSDDAPTSSLMVTTPTPPPSPENADEAPHALRSMSLFAIAPTPPRKFEEHDLVQIIVRETSQAKASHELDTKKDYELSGKIPNWPDFNLKELLNLQIEAGRTTNTPQLDVEFGKDFKGEGDYARKEDLTARLTAEVIEVLPNGNLILEACTMIKMDDEETTIKVTGICRPDDITQANTILSNQIHDLKVDKVNQGELKKSGEKGIIAKVLDTIFAF